MSISELHKSIINNSLKVGDSLPTLRELAASYKCSPNTAQKVLKELEGQGFLYNRGRRGYLVTAKQHVQSKQGCIAYISSTKTSHTISKGQKEKLIAALQQEAHLQGKSLLLLKHGELNPIGVYPYLQNNNIHGFIFEEPDKELLQLLSTIHIPIIYSGIYDSVEDSEMELIQQDDYQGARLAAQYFINQGYQQFIWFGDRFRSDSSRQRFMGALSVLQEKGFFFNPNWCFEPAYENLTSQIRTILTLKDRPKAIFCLWHDLNIAIYQVAKELQLNYPKDIHLVGWAEENELRNFQNYAPEFLTHNAVIVWSVKAMAKVILERLAVFPPSYSYAPVKTLLQTSRIEAKL